MSCARMKERMEPPGAIGPMHNNNNTSRSPCRRVHKLFVLVLVAAALVWTKVVWLHHQQSSSFSQQLQAVPFPRLSTTTTINHDSLVVDAASSTSSKLPRVSRPTMNSGYQESILLVTFVFTEAAVSRNYLRMFVESAKYSGVDLLLVGDPVPTFDLPYNVRHAHVTWDQLVDRVATTVFANQQTLSNLREAGAYKVNDLKPLFAFLFPEEVQGYDWWGTCDNDMLLGLIRNILSPEILRKADVYSPIDSNTWGPFTLYRNKPIVNEVFQLSRMPLETILDTITPMWFDEKGQGAWFPEGDPRWDDIVHSSMSGILDNHAERLGIRVLRGNVPFGYDGDCVSDLMAEHPKPCVDCKQCMACNFQHGYLTSKSGIKYLLCHMQFTKDAMEKSLQDPVKMETLIQSGNFRVSYPEGFNEIPTNEETYKVCTSTSRCQEFERQRRFSFLHVSKSGGSSWIKEMRNHGLNVYPNVTEGPEWTVSYQNSIDPLDHTSYHLVSMRSPRHHTWSLWSECRFDGWGIDVTANTDFPRSGQTDQEDVRDFTTWINRFVDPNSKALIPESYNDYYNCYHPANYQSRAFAGTQQFPHAPDSPQALVPNVRTATQTYWYFDFVALTEFFHESKCLLFHRIQDRTPAEQAYMDETCHCRDVDDDTRQTKDVKNLHHNGRRRKSMRDLDANVLRSIHAATNVDVAVYQTALQQFLREVVWLEFDLGRRVMCDGALQKWEPELQYLGLNVTQLYQDASILKL